jgi:predicted metal-dependent hydrolase
MLVKVARDKLGIWLEQKSRLHGITFDDFRTSITKSKWGSCDSKGVIHLNSWLIILPYDLVDYVISHELSHISNMNHSKQFWEQVAKLHPQYKNSRIKIKKYNPGFNF